MKKENLVRDSLILTRSQQIQDETVSMITANNLAIQRLETVFLKFDLHLLKLNKKIYDLRRDLAGTQALVSRCLRELPDKKDRRRK